MSKIEMALYYGIVIVPWLIVLVVIILDEIDVRKHQEETNKVVEDMRSS